MKPPPFEYLRAQSLEHALKLLAQTENCKLLAGGQSLMAMLNLRYVFPDALIDLNRIAELSHIDADAAVVSIGAMTRQRALEQSPLIRHHLPIFGAALPHVGHRQTRNRGTIGGSLCHLDPSAELPTLCLAYDAEIEVASAHARRRVGIREFITGYMSVALAPDEMVTRIDVPVWRHDHAYAFLEHSRRHGDFAIASVACLAERDPSGRVSRVALAVGGLSDTPIRLDQAEALLLHSDGGEDLCQHASATIADLAAFADIHASADYRRHVAMTLVRRGLERLFDNNTRSGEIAG